MAQTIVMQHIDKTRIFRVFKKYVRVTEKSATGSSSWHEWLREYPRYVTTDELAEDRVSIHVANGWKILSDTRKRNSEGVKHRQWQIDTARDGIVLSIL